MTPSRESRSLFLRASKANAPTSNLHWIGVGTLHRLFIKHPAHAPPAPLEGAATPSPPPHTRPPAIPGFGRSTLSAETAGSSAMSFGAAHLSWNPVPGGPAHLSSRICLAEAKTSTSSDGNAFAVDHGHNIGPVSVPLSHQPPLRDYLTRPDLRVQARSRTHLSKQHKKAELLEVPTMFPWRLGSFRSAGPTKDSNFAATENDTGRGTRRTHVNPRQEQGLGPRLARCCT